MTIRRMRAFSSPTLSGNPCVVSLLPGPPESADTLSGDATQCATWEIDNDCAEVRCWNPAGHLIACCGHGLLSCAALWTQRWAGDGRLRMGATDIACYTRGEYTWTGFAPLTTAHCDMPDWLANFPAPWQPLHCAEAGGAQGYLIVQLPAGSALESLSPPGETLADHTRRALVVTAQAAPATTRCGEDIHLRYFAPQYGQPEDTATGSAMRILADYWRQRGLGDHLTARQCSQGGGLLYSRIAGGRTWVGGRVAQEISRNVG